MTVAALNWAFTAAVKPSGAKFVLVALADHADADGYCWPSQVLLAAKTGQSPRTVRDHLASLEADGWIVRAKRRKKGRQTSDAFNLIFAAEDAPEGTTRAQAAKSAAGTAVPEDGAERPAQAAKSAAGTGSSQAAENDIPGGEKPPIQAAKSAAEPLRNHQEPGARRAREARPCGPAGRAPAPDETGPDGAGQDGDDDAASEVPSETWQPPPANAVWHDSRARLMALIGPRAFATWLDNLLPISDDGEHLVLGAPSRFLAEHTKEAFGENIEAGTARRVEIRFDPRAANRASRLEREAGKPTQ